MRPVRLGADVVPPLLNDVAGREETVVLVIDDLHLVSHPDVHASLALLVDRLPPTLRVTIASRSEPPLPVARMRARGELSELSGTTALLRRGGPDLLGEVVGRRLATGDVEILQRRTEGWAAGLYLAGLSLRGRQDPARFIAQFAGDHRHLVDYLGGEVLSDQPPARRRFLLRTSVLARLSAPLCDAVLDTDDAAAELDEIRRSNLFLVALDDTGTWFRYHHLFADLLRHELDARLPARWPGCTRAPPIGTRPTTGRRRRSTTPSRAVTPTARWSSSPRPGTTSSTVASSTASRTGSTPCPPRPSTATRASARRARGSRSTAAGSTRSSAGSTRPTARWRGGRPTRRWRRASTCCTPSTTFKRGRLGSAIEAAESVLRRDVDEPAFPHTVGNLILAAARHWHGDGEVEEPLGRRSPSRGRRQRAGGRVRERLPGDGRGGARGQVGGRGPARRSEGGPRAPRRPGALRLLARALAAAEIALDRGDLERAEEEGAAAVELADRGGGLPERAAARLALARARHAIAGAQAGRPLVGEAGRILARCPDPGRLALDVERTERALRRRPRGARRRRSAISPTASSPWRGCCARS